MEAIARIIDKLGVDKRIKKLFNREVKLPGYIDDFNSLHDYWYPHPPCLVPVFLGYGASYKGIINHFFCDREKSYVDYHLEHGHITETARTADQLITLIVLRMIMVEDELTPKIKDFCKSLDYVSYEDVEQFAITYGDDPQEFGNLVFFDQRRPFEYIKDLSQYNGNYPSSLYILNHAPALYNSSIFEIAAPEKLSAIENLPSWLIPGGDKKAEFYQYLYDDKFKEAWFTLNTMGWSLKDVAEALTVLSSKVDDELLSLVTENWISGWKRSPF